MLNVSLLGGRALFALLGRGLGKTTVLLKSADVQPRITVCLESVFPSEELLA